MANTTLTTDPLRRWYLLANGSRAQAYVKRAADSGYDQVRAWDAPDARMKDSELGEDKPGRAFAAGGSDRRSGIELDAKDDSPKEHAKRDFLAGLAHDLATALDAKQMDCIAIIAPAPVAHAIVKHLPGPARKALSGEEHHDLTSLPHDQVFARLDAFRHRM
jgi:signal transduction histidine kinase